MSERDEAIVAILPWVHTTAQCARGWMPRWINRDDLEQVGALAAVRAYDSHDPSRGSLRVRMRYCVRQAIFDTMRNRGSDRCLEARHEHGGDVDTLMSHEAAPDDLAEVTMMHEKVMRALPGLSAIQQEVVVCRLLLGQNNPQIAKRWGMVKSRPAQVWGDAVATIRKGLSVAAIQKRLGVRSVA
jgi:RNA polymerase sigma factor (sigma-70 family)